MRLAPSADLRRRAVERFCPHVLRAREQGSRPQMMCEC